MYLPLSTAFTVSHRFWVVVFSFSFVSMHILICFFISSVICWLFRSVLFNLHMFVFLIVFFPCSWYLILLHCNQKRYLRWFQFFWIYIINFCRSKNTFWGFLDFISFSINVNHGKQHLNDSIRNGMATIIITIVILVLSIYYAMYSTNEFYTLDHRTWHLLLLWYFSRWSKIS